MQTLREVIDGHAAAQPDAPFLFAPEPGTRLTYAELRSTARALGAELAAHGIAPGEVVSYMLPNGVAAASVFLGAMYGGYVVSPVSLLAQDALIEHTLAHSETRIVFAAPEFADAAVGRSSRGSAAARSCGRPRPTISRCRATGANAPPVALAASSPAMLMYTSGTTGTPKGALLSHGNLVHAGQVGQRRARAHAGRPRAELAAALPRQRPVHRARSRRWCPAAAS